jgi:hypothetical protein
MMADIPKVKRNIQRMIDQGAPEADIDSYVASEGVDLGMLQAKPSPEGGTGTDMAKSYGTGLVEGVIGLASVPWDLGTLGAKLGANAGGWVREKLGMEALPDSFYESFNNVPGTSASNKALLEENVTGPLYEPQTTAGEYARTAGQFTPGVAGPGGIVRNALSTVGAALTSETAGQITKGTKLEPYARAGGALLGGAAPSMLRRGVTPFPSDPTRQAAVKTLADEGVDLTAGQKTGNKALKYLEAEMGGDNAAQMMTRQKEQLTGAALGRIGESGTHATGDILEAAKERIGKTIEDLGARNKAKLDPQFRTEAMTILKDYRDATAQPIPLFNKTVKKVLEAARNNNGELPGDIYQNLRSKLTKTAAKASDGDVRTTAAELRNSLDSLMDRNIAGPDKAAWQEARRQWGNMKVIEKAVSGAGEDTAAGLITPSKLRSAAEAQNRVGYVRGKGDFNELARAGEMTMKPLPDSGTPGRLRAQGVTNAVGMGAGAALGAGVGGPPGAVIGSILGHLAPGLIGKAAMTKTGQKYLSNQLVKAGVPKSTAAQLVIELQLSQQGARPVDGE